MLDTVDFNHVQHISFTQSRLTDAVSVILSELLSYEHPSKWRGVFVFLFHRNIENFSIPIEILGNKSYNTDNREPQSFLRRSFL